MTTKSKSLFSKVTGMWSFIIFLVATGLSCLSYLAQDMDFKHQVIIFGAVVGPMLGFYFGMKKYSGDGKYRL